MSLEQSHLAPGATHHHSMTPSPSRMSDNAHSDDSMSPDELTKLMELAERRKRQNRNAQRKYRSKLKKQMEQLKGMGMDTSSTSNAARSRSCSAASSRAPRPLGHSRANSERPSSREAMHRASISSSVVSEMPHMPKEHFMPSPTPSIFSAGEEYLNAAPAAPTAMPEWPKMFPHGYMDPKTGLPPATHPIPELDLKMPAFSPFTHDPALEDVNNPLNIHFTMDASHPHEFVGPHENGPLVDRSNGSSISGDTNSTMGMMLTPPQYFDTPIMGSPSLQPVTGLGPVGGLAESPVNGRNALHIAAMSGHEAIVKVLVTDESQGGRRGSIDVNAKDEKGWTALHLAAERGHMGCVRLLLENGADFLAVT